MTRRLLCTALLAALAAGCPPNRPLEPIQPEPLSAGEVIGGETAKVIEEPGEPLVVDWKSDQRGALEIAMKTGVAVVRYERGGVKLLRDCRIEGTYGFLGVTTKTDVYRIEDNVALGGTLPLLAARLEGGIEQGRTIDIAVVMVGQRRTTWIEATQADLQGRCEGATHFVRGAYVGAFAVDAGSSGKARAAVEVFDAGTGTEVAASDNVRSEDGQLEACDAADPESDRPPAQCGALIRLQLTPLGDAKAVAQADEAPVIEQRKCPPGLVFSKGVCTKAGENVVHQCRFGDAADCQAMCERDEELSCDNLGVMYAVGEGVQKDQGKARSLFLHACKLGSANGCFNLGKAYRSGFGGAANAGQAARILAQACKMGQADACGVLGDMVVQGAGVERDDGLALQAYDAGCRGGSKDACSGLGNMYLGGTGVPKDEARAARYYLRACQGKSSIGCGNLGYMLEFGRGGLPKDRRKAAGAYATACEVQASNCAYWGVAQDIGLGVSRDAQGAVSTYRKACQAGDAFACAVLQVAHGGPAVNDAVLQESITFWTPACEAGLERDCTQLGVVQLAAGQKQEGRASLAKGCSLGDAWACKLQRDVR